jgi:magnesium chelatase family protein
MEDGVVTVARVHSAIRFPARFMLVAAMNPTSKGTKPTDEYSQREMDRYLSKVSSPLLDRIDIHVEVPPVPYKQLAGGPRGTDSATLRQQVNKARSFAAGRQNGHAKPNAALTGRELDKVAALDDACQQLLKHAVTELGLSARAYDKIRRVSRTIADFEESEKVQSQHVLEAIGYRLLDRQM